MIREKALKAQSRAALMLVSQNITALVKAGNVIDLVGGGQLTKAGRGLAKHGGRLGSLFPAAKGNPSQINQQGESIVREIVSHPNKVVIPSADNLKFDVYAPDGKGVRFFANGAMEGLIER